MCLPERPTDGGALGAAVHGVTEGQTRLSAQHWLAGSEPGTQDSARRASGTGGLVGTKRGNGSCREEGWGAEALLLRWGEGELKLGHSEAAQHAEHADGLPVRSEVSGWSAVCVFHHSRKMCNVRKHIDHAIRES